MTLLSKVEVQRLCMFPGACAGLREKTATLTLAFDGDIADWPNVETRLRKEANQLLTFMPLWGINESDFPGVFVDTYDGRATFSHWIIALTVVFQRWARDPVWQGKVIAVSDRSVDLALPWQREDIFSSALRLALRCMSVWMQPESNPEQSAMLAATFERGLAAAQVGGLSPGTQRFAMAAHQRGIPVAVNFGALRLGYGINGMRMDNSFTGNTTCIAANLARNKAYATQLLREGGVPVAPGTLVRSIEEALSVAKNLAWPVVVKPCDLDMGAGVVPDIRDEPMFRLAYTAALELSPRGVIVEKHIHGDDHRMLVVGGKLSIVTKRTPGGVIGDGVSTVAQLLKLVNADPLRGTSKHSMLITLSFDEEARTCLNEQGLTIDAVPVVGQAVRLRRTANISTGGTALDVTDRVHPDNILVAERAAKLIGLDIAGVDFLCPDISRSWREVGGAVCEVNAQPGLRVNWLGDPERDLNGEIIDWLFDAKPNRIPIAAITGTNGKSTTAQMLHHIWLCNGTISGVCTTQGVWVGRDKIVDDNLSGFPGGKMLLNDPTVEAAIIEMPRKGLLMFGHPCDYYDVAAMLNIQDDHIGEHGVHTLDEMARIKAEVLQRSSQTIVINAEDALCLAMRERCAAPRHILVARAPSTAALQTHLSQGQPGVYVDKQDGEPWIFLHDKGQRYALMRLAEIPATMNGFLSFNEMNALFAAGMAWAQGISHEVIRQALSTFSNSREQNPGRYNFIQGYPFRILLDYAHNPDGVGMLCELLEQIPAKKKIGVCLQLGNRCKDHIRVLAPVLAKQFDHCILGQDAQLVARSIDYAGGDPEKKMMAYFYDEMRAAGLSVDQLEIELDQSKAVLRGLDIAEPGDLLVLMVEECVALPILDAKLKQNFESEKWSI